MAVYAKKTSITPQEYLQWERKAETKSEYHDGEVVAMAGASWEHNLITGGIGRHLGNQLESSACNVVTGDQRVRVPACNRYYYPDVVVVCTDPQFEDTELDTLLNPTLIVEVLSDSTERADRREKWDCYRTLESLEIYILAAQDAPRLECYSRQEDGSWRVDVAKGMEAILTLPQIECQLRLAEVYARIKFPSETG